jgi:hypothetical protein
VLCASDGCLGGMRQRHFLLLHYLIICMCTRRTDTWARPCVWHAVDGGWQGQAAHDIIQEGMQCASRHRALGVPRVAASTPLQRITLAWLCRLMCGGCEADGGFDGYTPQQCAGAPHAPFRPIPLPCKERGKSIGNAACVCEGCGK